MASRREEDDRPAFQVSARTILQLGGELISSDGIAFYELIKNAVDAGSREVRVGVASRLPLRAVQLARAALGGARTKTSVSEVLAPLAEQVITTAPGADELAERL